MATSTINRLPRTDAAFLAFVDRFVAELSSDPDRYHIDPGRTGEVADLVTRLVASRAEVGDLAGRLDAARVRRRQLWAELQVSVRSLVRILQNDRRLTDEDRASVGVPPRVSPAVVRDSVPTVEPDVRVWPVDRLRHALKLRPVSGGSIWPEDARGVEVHRMLGVDGSQDPTRYRRIEVMRRRRLELAFDASEAGEMAHYLFRYVDRRGRPGPWSQVVSVTVPGA